MSASVHLVRGEAHLSHEFARPKHIDWRVVLNLNWFKQAPIRVGRQARVQIVTFEASAESSRRQVKCQDGFDMHLSYGIRMLSTLIGLRRIGHRPAAASMVSEFGVKFKVDFSKATNTYLTGSSSLLCVTIRCSELQKSCR